MTKLVPFALVVLVGAAPAAAFRTTLPIEESARWSAEAYRGTGLHDGLQVGVAPGFAAAFGLDPALARGAVEGAFAAWESPVLRFEVAFDAPVEPGTEPGEGLEIDVFARSSDAEPGFEPREPSGHTNRSGDFVKHRLLTSGQRLDGRVVTGADIELDVDWLRSLADGFGLPPATRAVALQRMLMHHIGHALGLGHPDSPANLNLVSFVPPFPCNFRAGVMRLKLVDENAIMSSGPDLLGLLLTSLQEDDWKGRHTLYPAPAPGQVCPPLPPDAGLPANASMVLDERDPAVPPLGSPQEVLFDPDGMLLVAIPSGVFRVRSPDDLEVLVDTGPGGNGESLGTPIEVQFDSKGTLYVSGSKDVVLAFDETGQARTVLDRDGDGEQPFSGGVRMRVDAQDRVYVVGSSTNNVFRIDPDGAIHLVVGPEYPYGRGPLSQPVGLALDSRDNLYVLGSLSNNVLRITPDGDIREVLGQDGGGTGVPLARPNGPAVDPDDNVYVGSSRDVLYRIAPDGAVSLYADLALGPVDLVGENTGLAGIDALGNLYAPVTTFQMLRVTPEREIQLAFSVPDYQVAFFDYWSAGRVQPDGSFFYRVRGGFRNSRVLRIGPACRDGVDVPPEITAVRPLPLRAGHPFLVGLARGFDPGGRLFLDADPLPTVVLGRKGLLGVAPDDAAGPAELRYLAPPSCPSAPVPVDVRSH